MKNRPKSPVQADPPSLVRHPDYMPDDAPTRHATIRGAQAVAVAVVAAVASFLVGACVVFGAAFATWILK